MWRVCGCNHGCSGVAVAREDLKKGMKVKIVSGVEKGRDDAWVEMAPVQGGGEELSLGRDEPNTPAGCQAHRASPLLAYGCESEKSGAMPENACASGCGEP